MRIHTIVASLVMGLSLTLNCLADAVNEQVTVRNSYDPGLQASLEQVLGQLGLSEAVSRQQLSVALVDISQIDEPRMAEVNGDLMIYAASLPKIAILLTAFVDIEKGLLELDSSTRESLTQMIRVSSNRDATRMINLVGKHHINEILQSERFRLYDPLVNGGLWVGKEYASGKAFQRDPLHNISHGATALQTARYYYLLETGQLVNPKLSQIMKDMLVDSGIKHKFVKGLSARRGVKIYRKSGSWQQWHADSALVEAQGHKYILVGLSKSPHGGEWLTRLAAPLHDLIVPTITAHNRF